MAATERFAVVADIFRHLQRRISDADITAVSALFDVTTEDRCPARLDRAHNPTLPVG